MMMRLYVLIMIAGFFGSTLQAQDRVPQVVLDAFQKQHPNAYAYEWEWKKKKGLYEAEFIDKGYKYEALFTPEGEWKSTEREISKKDAPPAIWDSLSKTAFADWEIDDIEEHQTPRYERVYVIEVENKTYVNGKKQEEEYYLYFLPDGSLVEKARKK